MGQVKGLQLDRRQCSSRSADTSNGMLPTGSYPFHRLIPNFLQDLISKFNKSTNQEEYAPVLGYMAKTHPDGLISETKLLKYIWDNYIQ
jgi:hypothetical protein